MTCQPPAASGIGCQEVQTARPWNCPNRWRATCQRCGGKSTARGGLASRSAPRTQEAEGPPHPSTAAPALWWVPRGRAQFPVSVSTAACHHPLRWQRLVGQPRHFPAHLGLVSQGDASTLWGRQAEWQTSVGSRASLASGRRTWGLPAVRGHSTGPSEGPARHPQMWPQASSMPVMGSCGPGTGGVVQTAA